MTVRTLLCSGEPDASLHAFSSSKNTFVRQQLSIWLRKAMEPPTGCDRLPPKRRYHCPVAIEQTRSSSTFAKGRHAKRAIGRVQDDGKIKCSTFSRLAAVYEILHAGQCPSADPNAGAYLYGMREPVATTSCVRTCVLLAHG